LVAFQFKELQDCYTLADLKEQLNQLPKDLDAMYGKIFQRSLGKTAYMLSNIAMALHFLHTHWILKKLQKS